MSRKLVFERLRLDGEAAYYDGAHVGYMRAVPGGFETRAPSRYRLGVFPSWHKALTAMLKVTRVSAALRID